MILSRCFNLLTATALLLLHASGVAGQQFGGIEAASVVPPAPVALKPNAEIVVPLMVRIRAGYHINSHTPFEDYLIPTKLTWQAAPLSLKKTEYPDGEIVAYEFSEQPLSVYSDKIVIKSTFRTPEKIPAGLTEIPGKLRYQACTDKACLPPRTIEVAVPVHFASDR